MNNHFNYINAVKEALTNADMHYSFTEKENSTVFRIPISAKNLPVIIVSMRVYDDGDIKLNVYPIKKVADRFRKDIMDLLNGFNNRYRFASFALDSDGDICVDYDMMLMTDNPDEFGEKLVFLTAMFADIVDDTYIPMLLTSRCGLTVSRAVSNIINLSAADTDDDDDCDEDDDEDDDCDGENSRDDGAEDDDGDEEEDTGDSIDDLYDLLCSNPEPTFRTDDPYGEDDSCFETPESGDDDEEDSF